jgi:hypothetical protein
VDGQDQPLINQNYLVADIALTVADPRIRLS